MTNENTQASGLRETLQAIVDENPRNWKELSEPMGEFERWAKARAIHALSAPQPVIAPNEHCIWARNGNPRCNVAALIVLTIKTKAEK